MGETCSVEIAMEITNVIWIDPDIDKRINLYDLCKNKWIHKDSDIMKKIEYVNVDEEIKKFKEFQKLKSQNNYYEKISKRKRKKFHFKKK